MCRYVSGLWVVALNWNAPVGPTVAIWYRYTCVLCAYGYLVFFFWLKLKMYIADVVTVLSLDISYNVNNITLYIDEDV